MTSTRTSKKLNKAWGYCRISLDLEGEGKGVARQRQDVTSIAQRSNLELVEIVEDNDMSASQFARKKRTGWGRMLEAVEAGEIDTIIAYNLDRLTRQPKELERLIELVQKYNLSILTLDGTYANNDVEDWLKARITVAVAAQEVLNMSRRQKRKLKADAEQGKPHWIRRPYGYELDGTIRESEAITIREWAERFLAGESLRQLALDANKAGLTSALGKPWTTGTVKRTIESPRTAGLREYNGEVIGQGQWTGILTIETHDAVVAKLSGQKRTRPNASRGRVSVTSHLVTCAACGGTMVRSGNPASLRCGSEALVDGKRCVNSMTASYVDDLLGDRLLEHVGRMAVRPAAQLPDETENIAVSIMQLEQRLTDAIESSSTPGGISLKTLERLSTSYEKQIAELQDKLVAISADDYVNTSVIGDPATLADRWNDEDSPMDPATKNLILRTLCKSVTLAPRDPAMPKCTPDLSRITVVFK